MSKHSKALNRKFPSSREPNLGAADLDRASIETLAYQLWLEKGCPIGFDQDDWLRAELILNTESGEENKERAASA